MSQGAKKAFQAPKSVSVRKDGHVKGQKHCGGLGGRVTQPSTGSKKAKTNP